MTNKVKFTRLKPVDKKVILMPKHLTKRFLLSLLNLNAVAYHKKLQFNAVASLDLSDEIWEKLINEKF